MKTAKERFEEIKKFIDSDMIPEGCQMRLWVNDCTRKELFDLGAELEIACQKIDNNNSIFHLYIEYKGHDIYLWE